MLVPLAELVSVSRSDLWGIGIYPFDDTLLRHTSSSEGGDSFRMDSHICRQVQP